ncbi:ABC transporter substrate-binding protein [Arthrobacter sp. NPDC057013]|uniref:ABC transporter substrate-binding protein n=1 Tax=Arthrobacter sp. NPDC057013 TaxID=3345999 RepID=UPI00363E8574
MKQSLRHMTVALTASAILTTALAGCGASEGSTDKSGPGAITAVTDDQLKGSTLQMSNPFGNCPEAAGTNTDLSKAVGECATLQTLVNKFNADNKWGIKVQRLGGSAWDSYYDALNTAFAGGNPPDVAVMHGSSLVDYAKRNLLVPLDDLAAITKLDTNDIAPAAKTAIGYNDKTYAVPFDVHAILAHVNVDIFKAAGLIDATGKPKLPTSTEEFLADAKTVKEKTGKNFMAVARSGDQLGIHTLHSLMQQQGGDFLNADGTKPTLDSPQARTALSFLDEVFKSGYANGNQTYDAAGQSFLNGDAAMLVNGTWVVDEYSKKAKFNYEATNFPTLYDKPAVWADSHTWVIPKHADADPVKYRAAAEFLSFLNANDSAWALGTGHIAAQKSVLNSAAYKAAPQRANYADTGLSIARAVPHIASWPAVAKAVRDSIESIWFQGRPVDQALKDGDNSINAALTK